MCRNDTVCHRSVYFKLTRNRKGKRLGTPLATEPLGKTKKPKRSFLKTRCRGLIVSRQRNDFNVKATNRPDDLRAPPGNRLEAARLATQRASATYCAALGACTKDDARPAPQHLTRRIRRILTELAAAQSAQDMELSGDRRHPLKCDRRVSGNWRIVFRFVEGEVVDVDLIDYH